MEKHDTTGLVIQFIALILAVGVVLVLGSYPVLLLIGITLLLLVIKRTMLTKVRKMLIWHLVIISFALSIALLIFNSPYLHFFPINYYPAPIESLDMYLYDSILWELQDWDLLREWLIPPL